MQNLVDLSRHFNWVDILIFVIFARLVFVSLKEGLAGESFKLAGTLSALYLALHYWFLFALYLNTRAGSKTPPSHFLQVSSFCFFCILGYALFWLIRILTFRIVTAQINPFISRWGGFTVGILRAFLLSSLVLFSLLLTGNGYFRDSVRFSSTGSAVMHIAPATYTWVWNRVTSKFMFHEKLNKSVADTLTFEPKKKK